MLLHSLSPLSSPSAGTKLAPAQTMHLLGSASPKSLAASGLSLKKEVTLESRTDESRARGCSGEMAGFDPAIRDQLTQLRNGP